MNYLSSDLSNSFFVPPTGTWHLIYSNSDYKPLWQFHVVDLDKANMINEIRLPRFEGINGLDLQFNADEEFYIRNWSENSWKEFSRNSLYEYFLDLGLVIEKNVTTKKFNSASSSIYHNWQMTNRFVGGVTDIDLYRFDRQNNINELFEIKRSRISIDKWEPYSADKGGYEILYQVAKTCGIDFTILYYEFNPTKNIEKFHEIQVFTKLEGFNFIKKERISIDRLIKHDY